MKLKNSKLELCSQPPPEDVSPKDVYEENSSGIRKWFKVRHLQAFLLFLCYFTSFLLRTNISVAIVSMTDRNSSNPNFEEFEWNDNQQSQILSAFFWGYLVIQLPAGQLGQHFSPKIILLISNFFNAVLALVTPVATHYGGWGLLYAIRVGQGVSQGFLIPLSYTLASKWAPPNERNRFVGFSLNGGTLGAAVALPLCGLLASSSYGWPSIFYVCGAIGALWVVLWAFLGADEPKLHSFISEEEKDYIQSVLSNISEKKLKTPWKSIFTSVPVLALICAHLGIGWTMALITNELPTYINFVLRFDIASNGFLSALPYITMCIATFPVCWLADYIKKRKLLSENVSRKLWTTVAETGGSLLLLSLGFLGSNASAAITMLTLSVSLASFIFCGYNINHLDLSPNFAGVLMGITNGLESVSSLVSTLAVGWIITDMTLIEQWKIIFILNACINVVGNTIFIIFGSTEIQKWNKPKDENDE